MVKRVFNYKRLAPNEIMETAITINGKPHQIFGISYGHHMCQGDCDKACRRYAFWWDREPYCYECCKKEVIKEITYEQSMAGRPTQ